MANVAMSRMNGAAQDWLRGTKLMGKTYRGAQAWEDLLNALKERFSPVIASATVLLKTLDNMLMKLSVCFMTELCTHLTERTMPSLTPPKHSRRIRISTKLYIVTFFVGGLKENISKKVMAAADPPNTQEDSLKRARAIEAAEGRTRIPIMAVETDSHSEQEPLFHEVDQETGETNKEVGETDLMTNVSTAKALGK